MGKYIGRSVARITQELGKNIFYDTRQVSIELGKELGWTCVDSIERLFRESDCLTLHVSAQDIKGMTNEGLIGTDLFHNRQQSSQWSSDLHQFFEEVLHHPEDLIQKLVEQGFVRYAAVDVYPHEPRKERNGAIPMKTVKILLVFHILEHLHKKHNQELPNVFLRHSALFLALEPFRILLSVQLALSISDGLMKSKVISWSSTPQLEENQKSY